MMLLDNLSDLFQRGLEYAWDCEHVLLKELPRMVEAATLHDLQQTFDLHLVETKGHIFRLEQIFTRLERSPAAEKNEPIRVIAAECQKIIGHIDRSALLDAALVFCGSQIEQYEIGLYEALSGLARAIGRPEIAEFLDQILAEEKTAAHQLKDLAESSVNRSARDIHNEPPFALI
jgi:ferritin-like metal-binding protein YciE